jgi:hypothetical protein
LEYPDRVGCAQDRDRTREANAACSRGCRRENHRRGGVEVLATVVFADSEYVQPHLIGMLDLFDQIQETVGRAYLTAALCVCCSEAIDTNLHLILLHESAIELL